MGNNPIFGSTREEETPLIIAICIDARGGILFNRRRQSQDRAQREDLLRLCGQRPLWVAPYSAPLFRDCGEIRVDGEFLTKAAEGEVCFVEDRPILPVLDRIEAVALYDWDRAYPADVHLDLDPAAAGFVLAEEREFPGHSHERIVRRIYRRPAAPEEGNARGEESDPKAEPPRGEEPHSEGRDALGEDRLREEREDEYIGGKTLGTEANPVEKEKA